MHIPDIKSFKKSLEISKGLSEAVTQRKENTMAKLNGKNQIYKTLHRKL